MSKTIFRSTIIFSIFTILAQFFAVLRDIFLVRIVGVGEMLDTYYMAFKIPDLLSGFYMIFLGSVVFIPLLTKAYQNKQKKEVAEIINSIAIPIFSFLILLSVLVYFLIPHFATYFAGNLSSISMQNLIQLSRILLISQLIFPIGIISGALCMVYGKSFKVALSAVFYNIGILLGVIFLYPKFGINGLGFGVIGGSLCFALIQILDKEVLQTFYLVKIKFNISAVKDFAFKNTSRFVSVFMWQMFLLFLVFNASFLGESSVSIWSIAYGIEVSIISILGVSVASILMPIFSKSFVQEKSEDLKNTLTQSLIYTTWVSLIVSLILFLISKEFIQTLFYFSNIEYEKALKISLVFGILILALPMQNFFEILKRYLYSTEKIKQVSMLIILFMFFVILFQQIVLYFFDLEVLVASISIAYFFSNFITLLAFFYIYKKENIFDIKLFFVSIQKVFFATFFAIIFYFLILNLLNNYFLQINSLPIFAILILKGFIILGLILIFSVLLKDRILLEIFKKVLK